MEMLIRPGRRSHCKESRSQSLLSGVSMRRIVADRPTGLDGYRQPKPRDLWAPMEGMFAAESQWQCVKLTISRYLIVEDGPIDNEQVGLILVGRPDQDAIEFLQTEVPAGFVGARAPSDERGSRLNRLVRRCDRNTPFYSADLRWGWRKTRSNTWREIGYGAEQIERPKKDDTKFKLHRQTVGKEAKD